MGSITAPREQTPLVLADTRERIPWIHKAAYGVGHVCNDIFAALWFSYTLLYLQEVLLMPPVLAGAMLLIGQVVDAVATPVVGIMADRRGNRKSWHLAGTILVLFTFPLIFATCYSCNSVPTWLMSFYYAGFISFFQIGWAVVQISHLSLIPDLTSDQQTRGELTSIRYSASVCSSIVVYFITWSVFHVTDNQQQPEIGPEDDFKFRDIVFICTGLSILTSVWFHCGLKSVLTRPQTRDIEMKETKAITVSNFMYSGILLQVSLLYVASRLFLTISLVYMPLFLNESLGDETELIASVPLVSYISSFVASLGIKYANNYWGNKFSYMIGAIISTLGCAWIGYGMNWQYLNSTIYGAAILLGMGSSITLVTSLCITADLIGTHTENGAFIYSVVTFADKLLNGIAVMVIEDMKCEQKELCPHYYHNVLTFVCGASALTGLIVLLTMFKVPLRRQNPPPEAIHIDAAMPPSSAANGIGVA